MRLTLATLALFALSATVTAQDYEFRVDFTAAGQPVNRALFSLVNFQHLWSSYGARGLETFRALKPQGSQARTETLIDQMEPVNDDGDPHHFTWSGFRTDRMYRFVNDATGTFFSAMLSEGMEPVLLLCYNTPWLAPGRQLNEPPSDLDEWAEFAAAVVASEKRVEYLEIWNEPSPQGIYWKGSMERYYQLFNTVADRIHRDYPGVQVGGPSVLGGQTNAMRDFITACGSRADYFTIHLYDDDPYLTTKKIRNWNQLIQKLTGKTGPQLLVTESDESRIADPAAKLRYLLIRQMELLAIQDQVLGFHQFSLPEYEVYGLVRPDGTPVDKNYWAYWLMRDLRGTLIRATAFRAGEPVDRGGARNEALPAYVTASRDGVNFQAVALVNDAALTAGQIQLDLTLPAGQPALQLRLDRLNGVGRQVVEFSRLAAGQTRWARSLSAGFGDAFSVSLVPVGQGDVDVFASGGVVTAVNNTMKTLAGPLVVQPLDSRGEVTGTATALATLTVKPGDVVRLPLPAITSGETLARVLIWKTPQGEVLDESLPFRQ